MLNKIVLTVGIAAVIFTGYLATETFNANRTYTACETSRTTDQVTEEACWNLQQSTGWEFLCTMRNSSVINHCWVEKNNELKNEEL